MKHRRMDTNVLFNLNMQLLLLGQNVCEVNRERSRLSAASSMCDSTKHNGLVTSGYLFFFFSFERESKKKARNDSRDHNNEIETSEWRFRPCAKSQSLTQSGSKIRDVQSRSRDYDSSRKKARSRSRSPVSTRYRDDRTSRSRSRSRERSSRRVSPSPLRTRTDRRSRDEFQSRERKDSGSGRNDSRSRIRENSFSPLRREERKHGSRSPRLGDSKSTACIACISSKHDIEICPVFERMTMKERWALVLNMKVIPW